MPRTFSSQPRRLVSIQQAAAECSVSSKTIRRRIADGSLTAYRLGPRVIRVDHAELTALLRPIPAAGSNHVA